MILKLFKFPFSLAELKEEHIICSCWTITVKKHLGLNQYYFLKFFK